MPGHRKSIVWALLALVVSACAHAPVQETQSQPPLRFAVIGDQTGSTDLDASYAILARGVEALNGQDIALVLHTGDLIESSEPPAVMAADFARAAALLDGLDAPWFMVPGDHDVNPGDWRTGSPDRNREILFQSLYAPRNPLVADQFYYSFEEAGVRFIGLNAHQHLHADPRWGVTFMAAIGQDQLEWLEQALAAPPAPRAVVVFVHQPLWYNWSAWAPVHALLARHQVDLVIAGHFHYGQIEEPIDDVQYLVVGATGGMTKHGSPNAGERHHVTVFDIDESGAQWRVIPLDPENAPARLSPRRDMDRVQALSSMLWQAGPRGESNADLTAGAAACLPAGALGNPLDLPVSITVIDTTGSPLAGAFSEELCPSGAACIAPPARLTQSSNTSSVSLRQGRAPVWRSAAAPLSGQVVVRASFESGGETYALQQPVTLGACPTP